MCRDKLGELWCFRISFCPGVRGYLDEQWVSLGDPFHVRRQHVVREELHVYKQTLKSQKTANTLTATRKPRCGVYMCTGSDGGTSHKRFPKLPLIPSGF